jgi:prephenate dehydrogenase
MSEGPKFKRVVVVGLGLLGGSVALALKRRKLARRVVGLGRDRGRLRPALDAGLVDEISVKAEGAAGADLIVLCGPFQQFERQLKALAPVAPEGCLVTDVGSVKGPLVARWHQAAGPLRFVASHPMAGGEKTGWRNARADMFEGAACLITPLTGTRRDAVLAIGRFWQALGAQVSLTSPQDHDRLIGRVSHLPHAAAFALAAAEAADGRIVDFAWAGKGWRDTTRVAASDEALWADIFLHHPKALQQGLRNLERESARLRALLQAGRPRPLRAFLRKASKFRRAAGEQEP